MIDPWPQPWTLFLDGIAVTAGWFAAKAAIEWLSLLIYEKTGGHRAPCGDPAPHGPHEYVTFRSRDSRGQQLLCPGVNPR